MWRSRAKAFRPRLRWLAPAALLALAPKCLLCLVGYTALGAALGLGGRAEICGAAGASATGWIATATALVLGAAAVVFFRLRRN